MLAVEPTYVRQIQLPVDSSHAPPAIAKGHEATTRASENTHEDTQSMVRIVSVPTAWPRILLAPDSGCTPSLVPIGRPALLGSSQLADVRVRDRYASARHAQVRLGRHGYLVEDLESRNGTWVDGVRVRAAWLLPGSSIRIGERTIKVLRHGPPAQQPASSYQLVGSSQEFLTSMRSLERLARVRQPVMIRGETGTGKIGRASCRERV